MIVWAAFVLILQWGSVVGSKMVAPDVGMLNEYDVMMFQNRLQDTLLKAKIFLTKEKSQSLVVADSGKQHRYEDKYLLAEQLTRSMADGLITSFSTLGITDLHWQTIREWTKKGSSVILRLAINEKCEFSREEEKEETNGFKQVEETSGFIMKSTTTKTMKMLYKEYTYTVSVNHRLEIRRDAATSPDDVVTIWNIDRSVPYATRQKAPPLPNVNNVDDLDISWLVELMPKSVSSLSTFFHIDREADTTWTPVRNHAVHGVLEATQRANFWLEGLSFQVKRWFDISAEEHRSDLKRIIQAKERLFVPVTVFFQQNEHNHTVIGSEIVRAFHEEQARSLKEVLDQLESSFPSSHLTSATASTLVTYAEARMLSLLLHMSNIVRTYHVSLEYIELMMRQQLTAALGKEISANDMVGYMSYHYRKMYKPAYHPQPWTISVRRSPAHSLEGGLRLERKANYDAIAMINNRNNRNGEEDNEISQQPIETFTRSFVVSSQQAKNVSESTVIRSVEEYDRDMLMSFPINAATRVYFAGERHIHAWLTPAFSSYTRHPDIFASQADMTSWFGDEEQQLNLVATAQQFSCYIVLLGRVSSTSTFDPKHAFIVQNKEELTIPLSLETIPNAKQFRDAIESLSPKQQRFARAYRSMQLESTLFGVVILQIKPQLEAVLNLYADSLTKEIALTKDLMELFIEYQIPADLLSADVSMLEEPSPVSPSSTTGENHATAVVGKRDDAQSRLKEVKEHVVQMKSMLQTMKEQELKEKEMEQKYKGPMPSSVPSSRSSNVIHGGVERVAKMSRVGGMQAMSNSMGMPEGQQEAILTSPVAFVQNVDAPVASSVSVDEGTLHMAPDETSPQDATATNKEVPADNQHREDGSSSSLVDVASSMDFTKLPQALDDAFDHLDSSHATRPGIIRIGENWTRERKKSLLGAAKKDTLTKTQLRQEKNAAFELLDALTRSGALVMEHAALHIVMATTHSFTDSVMASVIEQNRNPIEDLEKSSLVMVSTLYGVKNKRKELLRDDAVVGRMLESGVGGRSYEAKDMKELLDGTVV